MPRGLVLYVACSGRQNKIGVVYSYEEYEEYFGIAACITLGKWAKKMSKKIVWALFDSENQCVEKALSGRDCDVYSFGLPTCKKSNCIRMDLSDFERSKPELEKYPSPDYVFASPPCESWVVASASCKSRFTSEPGINLHWKSKWQPFDFASRYKEKRVNGIKTALFVCELLNHFRPSFWAIENGNRSLLFDYVQEFAGFTGYRNKCTYFSYGFPVIKRTIILSNALLFLKSELPKSPVEFTNINDLSGYKKRSLVPLGLYRDIFSQFKFGGQKLLFSGGNHA
jgi:hypothetical protein